LPKRRSPNLRPNLLPLEAKRRSSTLPCSRYRNNKRRGGSGKRKKLVSVKRRNGYAKKKNAKLSRTRSARRS
jgi:hypothetical protein